VKVELKPGVSIELHNAGGGGGGGGGRADSVKTGDNLRKKGVARPGENCFRSRAWKLKNCTQKRAREAVGGKKKGG